MRDDYSPHSSVHRPLLEGPLRLLRDRRADVADLLELDIEHDEALVDRIADDLVGARLVIRAALAAPPPAGISESERAELADREREAADLLRIVLVALHPGWC